jgi:hypothetical protein
MSRARRVCSHPKVNSGRCRRTAIWALPHGDDVLCWQHAVAVAHNRGADTVTHWITGQRRTVPTAVGLAENSRPLPTGEAAIIRDLNSARTRRAYQRCRRAIVTDLNACRNGRGLKPAVSTALARAKRRVGLPATTGVL